MYNNSIFNKLVVTAHDGYPLNESPVVGAFRIQIFNIITNIVTSWPTFWQCDWLRRHA